MGLLSNLAATAIRNKIVSELKGNCPQALQEALGKLLADKEAVSAIQGLVASCLSRSSAMSPQALLNLPFADNIKALLKQRPDLVQYLIQTALSRLPR